MAARVIQTRKQHRLCTLEDLRQVSGIGPRRLEALAGHVVFSDPLCATPPSK
jgi:DNA uptake protein ComE-like DNA-binding protein